MLVRQLPRLIWIYFNVSNILLLPVTIDCVYRWLQWCVKGVQCCWQILWKLIVKNTGCPVQFLSERPTTLILNLAWFLLCSSPFKLTYRREGKEAARGRQIVESSKRRGYFWKRVRGYGWRGEMNFWKTFLNVPCQNIHARKQPRFGSARKATNWSCVAHTGWCLRPRAAVLF